LAEDEEEWTVWLEKEELWKRYRTLSHVAVLEGEGLQVRSNIFQCHESVVRSRLRVP